MLDDFLCKIIRFSMTIMLIMALIMALIMFFISLRFF